MAVTGTLNEMGVPSDLSSAAGSTAAVIVSVLSGDVVTPANLLISVAGGIVGSQAALEAKNLVSAVIWHPKTVSAAKSSWNFMKSSWNYVCDVAQYFEG